MPDERLLDSPEKIAEAGERIYSEKYKAAYEQQHRGQYVAIDVLTDSVYLAQFPEEALDRARTAAPNGVFHLIRVGAPGAFRVSFGRGASRNGFWGRPLRPVR